MYQLRFFSNATLRCVYFAQKRAAEAMYTLLANERLSPVLVVVPMHRPRPMATV